MNNALFLIYRLWIVGILLWIVSSCASPGSIQGGPKDETPPKVDSLASSPNPALNFSKEKIVITFDEWVKLVDPFNQIFISPPLEQRPEFNLRKKSMIISFHEDEVLQDSTTYIINLGTSVQDITESNPVEDFQYVFSTGDELDSLGFSGMVTDILTGEPAENVSVMLYDNFADSAIATLPPAYFARTRKDGTYRFDYLRPDTFQLIGYIDDDQDYRYNEETEPLGFIPEPFSTVAVNGSEINFSLSIGKPPIYLGKTDTSVQSLILLTFDESVTDTAQLKIFTSPEARHLDRIENQIRIYYSIDSLPIEVITENIKGFRDTITVRASEGKEFDQKNIKVVRLNTTLLPEDPLLLKTNWPIAGIDADRIQLLRQDSSLLTPDTLISGFSEVSLQYPWQADSSYTMTLYPGAIEMENNLTHDTIQFKIQPVPRDKLASLIITLVPDQDYVLPPQFILQLKQKDKIIKTVITPDIDKKITFPELKPGAYTLTVIRDENKNGIWDPARYPGRMPAEQIQNIEIEPLRVNWIQETDIQLKQTNK